MSEEEPNQRIGVRITKRMRKEIEEIMEEEGYYNISDFVREALRLHIRGWRKLKARESKPYLSNVEVAEKKEE